MEFRKLAAGVLDSVAVERVINRQGDCLEGLGMFGFWRRVPEFWQNFIVGLLIIGGLLSLTGSRHVKGWEDWAVDLMISLNSRLERVTGQHQGRDDLQFSFLEMDEGTYRQWKEPFHIPRDKLLKLIKFASTGKAAVIIVDVNLSKEGIDPAADEELRNFLLNYSPGAPPLVLMRATRKQRLDPDENLETFRQTYLGDAERSNIHFAQPLFDRDPDKVIRNWIFLKQGCYKDKGAVLPSVQLLVYALLKDRLEGDKKNLLDLDASLRANRPLSCKRNNKVGGVRRPVIIGKTVFKQQRLGERLIYTMPWEGSGYPESPDLMATPANFITEGTKNSPPSTDYSLVRDRITLIGASYGASNDLHLTPLDRMPGGLIILNAVKSLSLFEQISPPPLYIRLAFLLTFITLMSYVFATFGTIVKLIIVTSLVFIFFVPISFWFFKYGVWFDFGILLLGIKLQHSASEFFEVRELKRLRAKMQEIELGHAGRGDSPKGSVPDTGDILDPDETEVRVRLRRNLDGSYRVKAAPAGGAGTEFNIGSDGLTKNADGYVLDLKALDQSD